MNTTGVVVVGVVAEALILAGTVYLVRRGYRMVLAKAQTAAWIHGFSAGREFVRSGENTKVRSPDYYAKASFHDNS